MVSTFLSLVATFFAFITLFIYLKLFHDIFISKTIKKSPSLSLFYFRFTIDGVLGVMNILSNLRHLTSLISYPPIFQFFLSMSMVSILNIRSVSVTIITLDRIFAVFFPILYHQNRKKLNNTVIICFILVSVPAEDNIALWWFCQFELKTTCPSFGCYVNQCYVQYSMTFDVIVHVIISSLLLLFVVQLFILSKCKSGSNTKLVDKANKLALIDAFIIVVFDIIPATIFVNNTWMLEAYGPLLGHTKITGYALEGLIVYRELRRNRIVPKGKSSDVK